MKTGNRSRSSRTRARSVSEGNWPRLRFGLESSGKPGRRGFGLFLVPVALACTTLSIAIGPQPSRADNWPGWRSDGNGVSAESGIPARWSASENVLWKTELPGAGISSPVVWDDRVFVTAADGKDLDNLQVFCLDRERGAVRWREQFWGTSPTLYHAQKSSMATPAPVTDGERVFGFFGTGDVFALTVDGELLWHRSLAAEYGTFENRFAASSSPLVFEDTLILQCDHYGASYVIAIDKETGANRWKVDRPECWLSWATPKLCELGGGRHELVVSGSHKLDAFDPRTGEKLWTVNGMQRECIPTPLFAHGWVYAVSGPSGPSYAIEAGGRGDVTETHVRWKNPRGAPFVPSAIVAGEGYFLVDDQGILTRLNAKTGRLDWQKRLGGAFTASPVAAAGKVYFTNEDGLTIVVAADSDQYEEIARNPLNEPVFSSAAISKGCIFLRTSARLYCIGSR